MCDKKRGGDVNIHYKASVLLSPYTSLDSLSLDSLSLDSLSLDSLSLDSLSLDYPPAYAHSRSLSTNPRLTTEAIVVRR